MNLSILWWIEPPHDLEHKQYLCLGYIQKVEKGLKLNNLQDFFYELKYHSKNIECFLTIRSMLELRGIPSPTDEQREYFNKILAVPDDNKDLKEIIKICKWSSKKLLELTTHSNEVFKKIESNINMYKLIHKKIAGVQIKPSFISEIHKNTGYLILRYSGSPVFECYKFIYDSVYKDTTFVLYKYYDMPMKADFLDVKMKVLEEDFKDDDMFIAVESELSYDTKKSLFPVLNQLFASKIYNRNILGLL